MSEKPPLWEITAHICIICMGRVLRRHFPEDDATQADLSAPGRSMARGWLYRCADCGVEMAGHAPSVICSCGFRVKGRSLGMRCEPNANKSPEFPSEIIARQA